MTSSDKRAFADSERISVCGIKVEICPPRSKYSTSQISGLSPHVGEWLLSDPTRAIVPHNPSTLSYITPLSRHHRHYNPSIPCAIRSRRRSRDVRRRKRAPTRRSNVGPSRSMRARRGHRRNHPMRERQRLQSLPHGPHAPPSGRSSRGRHDA